MIKLNNITLCIVDCINYENAYKAINYCSSLKEINFFENLYFSDKKFKNFENNIKHINIDKISNRREYDNFIIKEIYKYIKTDFLLIIQHDGIIYNTSAWNDNFLKYDYIGAPWPFRIKELNNVGNGGFSLRSTKFMEECSKCLGNNLCDENEDVYCCGTLYNHMISKKFQYADIKTAANFSTEIGDNFTNENSFGFHIVNLKQGVGNFNHIKHIRNVYENLY